MEGTLSQGGMIVLALSSDRKSPPMEALHAIVSHQRQDIDTGNGQLSITHGNSDNMKKGQEDREEDEEDDITLIKLCQEAGLSLKVMAKGKNSKGKEESSSTKRPTRTQEKWGVKTDFK